MYSKFPVVNKITSVFKFALMYDSSFKLTQKYNTHMTTP
jgi:hypothetical protein